MKKSSTPRATSSPSLLILVLPALLLVAPSRAALSQQVVTLAGDPFPPYVTGTLGENASGGIAVELIHELFSRIEGTEVRFPLIPWKRALREVRDGTKDGIPVLLKTPEREAYMVYTRALVTSESLVWYESRLFPDGIEWEELSDLNAYRIGIRRGYSYGGEIDKAIRDGTLDVTAVPSVEQLFTMLAKQRVDAVISNRAVGWVLARRHAGDGPIVPAPRAIGRNSYYMGFSKNSPASQLVPAVNRVIEELWADGTVERMMAR